MFHQPKKVPASRIVLIPSGWICNDSPRQQGNAENLAKDHRFFFFLCWFWNEDHAHAQQMFLCFFWKCGTWRNHRYSNLLYVWICRWTEAVTHSWHKINKSVVRLWFWDLFPLKLMKFITWNQAGTSMPADVEVVSTPVIVAVIIPTQPQDLCTMMMCNILATDTISMQRQQLGFC